MNAVLAIIAYGGRAIVVIYREGSRNKLISPLHYNFILNPSMAASSNPFQKGLPGVGYARPSNHGAGGGNGSIMVEMFVRLCLVSKKPSEREFFVPARTDLGVKLLTTTRQNSLAKIVNVTF
jgi:hypothetical protein